MTYFLFYDGARREYFVVEGDDWVVEDAYEEALNIVDVKDELEFIGIISAEEVDARNYVVY